MDGEIIKVLLGILVIYYGLLDTSQVSASSLTPHRSELNGVIVVGKVFNTPLSAATVDLVAMIDRYIESGAYANASKELATLEAKHPDSQDVLFMRARILSGQNNSKQATKILERLIAEYPDYPEPYNNLAALYAATGDLEKSREVLERGISSHKSYAILYDNLKSIWAALSKKEYARALGAKDKQQMPKLKQITALDARRLRPRDDRQVSASTTAALKDSAARQLDKPVANFDNSIKSNAVPGKRNTDAEVKTAHLDVADPSMNRLTPDVGGGALELLRQTSSVVEAKVSVASLETIIIQTVNAWARSWSRQEIAQYLAFYSDEFRPSGRISRRQWEQQRHSRIKTPSWIKIKLSEHKVNALAEGRVQVDVIQSYRSSRFSSISDKRFVFARKEGKWLIVSEQVLRNRNKSS